PAFAVRFGEAGPDKRSDEASEQRQDDESRPQEPHHHPTLRNSRKTVSARPIRAASGSAVSAPFSRFVPWLSSKPRGTWRPFSVVPSVLRSMRKNAPLFGSRRMRTCSRETSGDAVMRTSTGYAIPPRPIVTESLVTAYE